MGFVRMNHYRLKRGLNPNPKRSASEELGRAPWRRRALMPSSPASPFGFGPPDPFRTFAM
jgi:hypothetical protein